MFASLAIYVKTVYSVSKIFWLEKFFAYSFISRITDTCCGMYVSNKFIINKKCITNTMDIAWPWKDQFLRMDVYLPLEYNTT